MKKALSFQKIIIVLLAIAVLSVSFFAGLFLCSGERSAFAETTFTSNVLSDLQVDSSFSLEDYPQNTTDYSISVIQVAESKDGEVLLYAYQPSGSSKNYVANFVNMSVGQDSTDNHLYTLSFCNFNGTLYKYKIEGVTLPATGDIHYFNIVSIFRDFDSAVDTQADYDNTVNSTVFAVGKSFAINKNDGSCECVNFDTIEITEKFVGYCKYASGYPKLYINEAINSHFVAFSTDKPIDKLISAKLTYTQQTYSYRRNRAYRDGNCISDYESENFGTAETVEKTVSDTDTGVSYTTYGRLGRTYTWDRIQSVSEFIATEDLQKVYSGIFVDVSIGSPLTQQTQEALQTKQWVLRFCETSFTDDILSNTLDGTTTVTTIYDSTSISAVTLLRLKFMYDGEVYDLGVVDNRQTGSDDPANEDTRIEVSFKKLQEFAQDLLKWLMIILGCVACLVFFVIVLWCLKAIFGVFSRRNHQNNQNNNYSYKKRYRRR